jgi:sec-independent protein translocase protein TatC
MIAIEVASPFLIPFKLTLMLSVFIAIPYILYQFWSFIAPGLYQHERKMIVPLVISSTALFYIGIAFAYFVVFPLVFGFFTGIAPKGVSVMTDISKYLDFVLRLFFAFGFAFEVPIATIVLCWTGATSPEKLGEKRPYVIVGAFVIGMLLTPPDVISQTLLALPMWLLFELGIIFARFYVPKREKEDEESEEEENSIMPTGQAAGATAAAAGAAQAAQSQEESSGLAEPDVEDANDSGHGEYEPFEEEEYRELTDEEMDAEIDRIDAEMDELMDSEEDEGDHEPDEEQGKEKPKKKKEDDSDKPSS